jgi:hypothetical protein
MTGKTLEYPMGAASVRDEIRSVLRDTVVDHGSSMDGGGGFGGADLWIWVDGKEYLVTVKPTGAEKPIK